MKKITTTTTALSFILVLLLTILPIRSNGNRLTGNEDNEPAKKVINIKIEDSPTRSANLNTLIHDLLDDTFTLNHVDENPDFLFYTVSSIDPNQYKNCVRIFFAQEDVVPNFNKCDYGISTCPMEINGRNFRYLSLGNANSLYKTINNGLEKISENQALERRFVKVNNDNNNYDENKQKLINLLSGYKKLEQKNNDEIYEEKNNDFSSYKFTIIYEKINSEGYTTEGLLNAFISRSIPIYFGNPVAGLDFNKKAFIHVNDYDTLEEVANKVIELDNDDEAYMEMLNEKPLADGFSDPQNELKKFLVDVINKGNKPFVKNPLGLTHY